MFAASATFTKIMSATDLVRVSKRLHVIARHLADSDKAVTRIRARDIVRAVMIQECVEDPPGTTLESLASALSNLVAELQAHKSMD